MPEINRDRPAERTDPVRLDMLNNFSKKHPLSADVPIARVSLDTATGTTCNLSNQRPMQSEFCFGKF